MTPRKLFPFRRLACAIFFLCLVGVAMGQKEEEEEAKPIVTPDEREETEIPNELEVEVFHKGNCSPDQEVKEGDTISIHYEGRLYGQREHFSRSTDAGSEAYTFTVGAEDVMKGWNIGLTGACAGDKRILTIPPDLAYGAKGAPPVIPPDSTLVFNIAVLSVNEEKPPTPST